MRKKKDKRYSLSRNTAKQVLAHMLVFVMVFTAVFVMGGGKTIVVRAAADDEVTFYYYDPDCADNQCLALGLWSGTWGKLENTGTWIGSTGFTWFDKKGDNWFSCTIKYDTNTYLDTGAGMTVVRLAEDAPGDPWNGDKLWEFSSSDSSYQAIFGSSFKDPACKDGKIVSYASLTQETPETPETPK